MKKTTLSLLLLLTAFFSTYAQVQVGDGKITDQNAFPLKTSVDYSYTQSIYLSSEINTSGTITSIQWYYNGTSQLNNNQELVIYLGTTQKSAFASSTDWVSYSNLTKVYSGEIITNGTSGWKTITFDTPYMYNGIDNLVVAVDENSAGNDIDTPSSPNTFTNSVVSGIRSMNYNTYYDFYEPIPETFNSVASSMGNYIPNIIFGGINQACPTLHNISSSNVTDTSATVSWQEPNTTPSAGSQYYISTINNPPVQDTTPTGTILSGNSIHLNNLIASNIYYVWVRSNCENGLFSKWSEAFKLTTPCGITTKLSENFDTTIIPELPYCWTTIVRGPGLNESTYIKTGNLPNEQVKTSPNYVKMFNSTANTVDNDFILVSPNVSSTLSTGKYRLKFYVKATVEGGLVQIGTLNTNDPGTAVFTPLEGYDPLAVSKSVKEYTINFDNYRGSDLYVGIRMNTVGSYRAILLDNIRWELIPNCADVSEIYVAENDDISAKINWTSAENQNSWDITFAKATEINPENLPFENLDTNSATITGLSGSTTYNVWVRSSCSDTDKGVWIGPVSFTTDCPISDFLYEDFNNTPNGSVPQCWTTIIRGVSVVDPDIKLYTTDLKDGYPSNSFIMANGNASTNTNDLILISPSISTIKTGNFRLRFKAKQNVAIDQASIGIGTINSNTNAGVFNEVQNVPISTSATEYTVDFTSTLNSTDRYLAIKLTSQDTYIRVFIDDIIWEPIPTCNDVSNIKISSSSENSAVLQWASVGSADNWQIVYSDTSVTNPNSIAIVHDTDSTITEINNLTGSTFYKIWVRSVCNTDSYGAWIGPLLFKTPCPERKTLNEDLESTSIVAPNLPDCWSTIVRGPNPSNYSEIITKSTSQSHSGSNSISITSSTYLTGTNDVILVSPSLSTLNAGTYRLRFFAKGFPGGNPTSLQIGTLNNNTNSATFKSLKNIELSTLYNEYSIDFTDKELTDKFIGFRYNGYNNGGIYLDNIRFELADEFMITCGDISRIIITSITSDSAKIEWNSSKTDSSYEVRVAAAFVTSPNNINTKTTNTTSIVLNKLYSSYKYKIWIRSKCADDTYGVWTAQEFTTACTPVEIIEENFDASYEPGTSPQLPNCWTKILTGNITAQGSSTDVSDVIVETANSYTGTNAVKISSAVETSANNIILVSPTITKLLGGSKQLRFFAKLAPNSNPAKLQIGSLDTNTGYGTFTNIKEVELTSTYTEYVVKINAVSSTDPFFGFKISSTDVATAYVDQIFLEPATTLSTTQFSNSDFQFYPNPVSDILNISNTDQITAVSVFNILGQEMISKSVNNNLAKIDLSMLSNGTYLVKVSSNDSIKTFKVLKQ